MATQQVYPHDERVCIYPIYINGLATLAQGRRVAAAHAVDNPTLAEIVEVLEHLGYKPDVEDKSYPRDFLQRGRLRVHLKDPHTNDPTVPDIASRKELLRRLGTMIPNLKSRKEAKANARGVAMPGSEFFPPGSILPPGMMLPPPEMVLPGGAPPEAGGGEKKSHTTKRKKQNRK